MKNSSKTGFCFLAILFMVLLLIFLAESQVSAQKAGVLNFEGRYHPQYQNLARNKLMDILFQMGRFDVLLTGEMDRIVEDFPLMYYRRLDVEDVKRIGQRAGIDFLFSGYIENLEVYWDSNQRRYRAEAEINLRIYNANTGRLTSIISGRGTSSHGSRETAQYQALANCFSPGFIQGIKEEFLLTSTIKEIEEEYVVFFGGRDLGIKKGSRFQIIEPVRDEGGQQYNFVQIGLLEVIEVGNEISWGEILYAKKEITTDHLLEEMVSRSRFKASLGYKNLPVSLDDGKGRLNVPEFRVGIEVPFAHSTKILLGFAGGKGAFIFNFGGEHIREVPLIPGNLYGTFGGGAGLAMGMVEACGENLASAGVFLELFPGIKFYPRQEHGITISLEGIGRLATPLRNWQEINYRYPSPCGPVIRTSGFGVRISVGTGF